MENDPTQHIIDVMEPIINNAPDEKLSSTVYVTHEDLENPGEYIDEFIPKKDIKHIDDPYVKYTDKDGKEVTEVIDTLGGKYEILDRQPHVPGKKEHPHHHLKDQAEFDL